METSNKQVKLEIIEGGAGKQAEPEQENKVSIGAEDVAFPLPEGEYDLDEEGEKKYMEGMDAFAKEYLNDVLVGDFMERYAQAVNNHNKHVVHMGLIQVYTTLSQYKPAIHSYLKTQVDHTLTKAELEEEFAKRQKHFDNLVIIDADLAVIQERIALANYMDSRKDLIAVLSAKA